MVKTNKKLVSLLLVLAMTVSMFAGMTVTSFAGAADSLTIQVTGKGGSVQTIKTLSYDSGEKTFKDGADDAGLVTDFSDEADGAYVYTGINKKPDPRVMAVAVKGILLDDLITYTEDLAGLSLRGETKINFLTADGTDKVGAHSYNDKWGVKRYYYPDWLTVPMGESSWDVNNQDFTGTKTEVPAVLAVTGFHSMDKVNTAAEISVKITEMINKSDDVNSLRLFLGQKEGGDSSEYNLGTDSAQNISGIKFTPVYHAIHITGGTSAGTAGADQSYSVENAGITTSDNYFTGAEGETIVLTVTPDNGHQVESVTVTKDSGSETVTVTPGENDTYTFTMPGEAVNVAAVTAVSSGGGGTSPWYSDVTDGNYTVKTADELKELAQIVNGTHSFLAQDNFEGKTVALGENIALNGEWTPIGNETNAFAGTFDGAGKSITGLQITDGTGGYKGLFGNNAGTVKNFRIEGSIGTAEANITDGSDNIGGAAGYNSGTVTGVLGSVTIFVKSSGIYGVGGIVGQNGETGVVENCSNSADVTGTKSTGGVVGRSFGAVTSCFNTGTITGNGGGKDSVGGVVGQSGNKSGAYSTLVETCYNMGNISNSGGRWHGGIVGMADSKATVKNCYDVGEISKGHSWNWNPIIGHVDSAYSTVMNNYSLEGLDAGDTTADTQPVTIGTLKSEAEMKSDAFISLLNGDSQAFRADNKEKPINSGYPILAWQVPTIAFKTTPTTATVTVKDSDQNTITANQDGAYSLLFGNTYSYTVSAPGYKSKSGTVTVIDEETVTVSLTKSGGSGNNSGGANSNTKKEEEIKTVTTTTTENADGSKTVTVTDSAAGTVTRTTTWTDGTKLETMMKSGAMTAKVQLPTGKSQAVIPIPVEGAGPGTVAILVHADGREEILAQAVAENGVINVTVKGNASLKIQDNSKNFNDVPGNHWAADGVDFVTAREFFNGTSDNAFTPSGTMTRAMLVTVLHRMDGEPDAAKASFPDVAEGKWFSKAVAWASANGIASGYANGNFGPNDPITREQLAVIFYQYANYLKMETPSEGMAIHEFKDANKVSTWADQAMGWAIGQGLITGKPGNLLDPAGSATRAEVAVIIERFVEMM